LTELQQYFPNLLKNENQNGIITTVGKCGKKSSLDAILHRLLLTKVGKSNFVKVQEFSIDLSEAKAYLYAYSTRHRIHKWEDLNISVFI